MDLLNLVPWGTLGPSGLLAVAVLLIIRGDLLPRRAFEVLERERDYWRQACESKDATIRELSESTATTAALLRALPIPDRKAEQYVEHLRKSGPG